MDLDKLANTISNFEKSYLKLLEARNKTLSDVECTENQLSRCMSSLQKSQENNKDLNATVSKLQEIILQKQDFREKNLSLKKEIAELQDAKDKQEVYFITQIEELKSKMKDLESSTTVELQNAKDIAKQNDLEKQMQEKVDNLTEALSKEKNLILELEQSKNNEINKLSLQYEEKISQLTNQQLRLQNKLQPTSSNNEIFRKKLQHLQEESTRKEHFLRSRIKELEEDLAKKKVINTNSSHVKLTTPDYSQHVNNYISKGRGSGMKRKRT